MNYKKRFPRIAGRNSKMKIHWRSLDLRIIFDYLVHRKRVTNYWSEGWLVLDLGKGAQKLLFERLSLFPRESKFVRESRTSRMRTIGQVLVGATCSLLGAIGLERAVAAEPLEQKNDGTVQIPAFSLPESSLLGVETRSALNAARQQQKKWAEIAKACHRAEGSSHEKMEEARKCERDAFYKSTIYHRMRGQYAVTVTPQKIGGVYTEVFDPEPGVAPSNERRVLLNVHGGGFQGGSRTISHLESIPIAAVGKIRVISINYRQAPEYQFPAASEDVAAVYRELLKSYRPGNIGIFGSSAGGLLAAESIAWFEKHNLPLPAAVGMFAGAAAYYQEGDSGRLMTSIEGFPYEPSPVHPYFKAVDVSDPLAFPSRSDEVMAKFPPSLLLASTRDIALSSVAHTHAQLVRLGVSAELHVWEGLAHVFYYDPALPESTEVYNVVARFFTDHLGQLHGAQTGASRHLKRRRLSRTACGRGTLLAD